MVNFPALIPIQIVVQTSPVKISVILIVIIVGHGQVISCGVKENVLHSVECMGVHI